MSCTSRRTALARRTIAPAVCLALAATLAACAGTGASTPPPADPGGNPGAAPIAPTTPGEHFAQPTGTPFALPAGLSLSGPLTGDTDHRCPGAPEVGTGKFVRFCFPLANASATEVTLTLPPGLIFISKQATTQNGVLTQEQVIHVPGRATTVVVLHLYCINLTRHASSAEDEFSLGPVSDDAGLKAIADLVRGKTLDDQGVSMVQAVVWEVSDGEGITDDDRQALAAL